MNRFLMPTMLLLAGTVSLFSPLFAIGECGINPTVHLPSSCNGAYEVPANVPSGACTYQSDGSCLSSQCGGIVWSNAIAGNCQSAVITENNIPRCLEAYAVTIITLHEYAMECSNAGNRTCKCSLIATGNSDTASVCNCMDMEPLH